MKALVIAERADAARELAAGARTMADEVVYNQRFTWNIDYKVIAKAIC